MTYEETVEYLYNSTPMFQNIGAAAYKPGLQTSIALDKIVNSPHKAYKTIHIAGTNGKGSTSHLLAAILQKAGYKVGLYTSPHLIDFRERIRVNGEKISKNFVIDFIEKYRSCFEPLQPSFFELTSTLAFEWFKKENVDIAIIETGLGGRLDSTNIISPILSIITNISLDHTQYLGNTLEHIAKEKSGIIKENTPVVIGEAEAKEVATVFIDKAKEMEAPLIFASNHDQILKSSLNLEKGKWEYETKSYGRITGELGGLVQEKNTRTVLASLPLIIEKGFRLTNDSIQYGFEHVAELTGLMGRWQKLSTSPTIICDTGHNTGGWEYLKDQLKEEQKYHKNIRMIVGMVNDKDINGVLELMPKDAIYYFTEASVKRAMKAEDFANLGIAHKLKGTVHKTVANAISTAINDSQKDDLIFIGGSTFIVADALIFINNKYLDNNK